MYSPAVERLITELAKLPGIGPRTAQRLTFHMLRLRPEEILPLAAAIVDVKEKIGFCRPLLQPRRGRALHDLRRHAARRQRALRGRAAGRHRDHRAHARVPRALPRPRRAPSARSTGSNPPTCTSPSCSSARSDGRGRGHPGDQPHHDRRGDGDVHRRPAAADACASRAWPAGCRSAATSSMPTN